MKSYINILALVLLNWSLNAQTLEEFARNEMVYWKLRGRFTGDDNNKDVYNGFMIIGDGEGKSIPADKRSEIF
jgi:hypothetical protein